MLKTTKYDIIFKLAVRLNKAISIQQGFASELNLAAANTTSIYLVIQPANHRSSLKS
jgi:hypothetical protein